jgi:hypothetical protein
MKKIFCTVKNQDAKHCMTAERKNKKEEPIKM